MLLTLGCAWLAVLALIGALTATHALAPASFARVATSCAAVWFAIGACAAPYLLTR